MANKLYNKARMTVSGTPGTGTITLSAAVTGYISFATAGVQDAEVVSYAIQDGTSWEIGSGTYTAAGTTLARTTVRLSSAGGTTKISATSAAIVHIVVAAEDLANLLRSNETSAISIGYTVSPYSLGSKSTGWTVDPALGNYQYMTNAGAHAITAPSSDCSVDILVINGASSGAISFTGFKTPGTGVSGATYATTNSTWWVLSVRRINGVSTYSWNGPWT